MTPEDFSHDYLSVDGAGFSYRRSLRNPAWFRFPGNRAEARNLYFVRLERHPGAGLPGVVNHPPRF
jgi:phytoene desaturase